MPWTKFPVVLNFTSWRDPRILETQINVRSELVTRDAGKSRYFISLLFCFLALCFDVKAATISNTLGLSVAVGADGSYSVESSVPAWTLGGNLGATTSNLSTNSGTDGIGDYSEITFNFFSGVSRTAGIRLYNNAPVILFTHTYLSAWTNDLAFPKLSTYPNGLDFVNYGGSQIRSSGAFVPYDFSHLHAGSPWLFFDTNYNAFVISPAANFMIASDSTNAQGAISCGINPAITNLPANFTHQAILVITNGINQAFDTWGNALTSLSGKVRPANDAAVELNKLGYWTDHDATYYYNYVSNSYPATLMAVRNEFAAKGLPLGYMQLDSWWYPKGPADVWTANGSDGIYLYIAAPQLFTNGLAAFQQQLGLPLMTHSRWIDPSSPYNAQYLMSTNTFGGIVSIDPSFWTNSMAYLHAGGVATYEPDWLDQLASAAINLNDPPAFVNEMASAASAQGINMQYCAPTPSHILQGSLYNNLLTSRVSDDGFTYNHWDTFIYDSRFVISLGIWPWTDVFYSTQTSDLLIATLSAGPVGVGDALGAVVAANLSLSVRPDSVIVKPDVPLMPLDFNYLNDFQGKVQPLVASTYTDHGGIREYYVFAYARTNTSVNTSFSLAQLGITGDAYVYDYFNKTGVIVTANGSYNFNTTIPNDITGGSYFIVSPIGQSGLAFIGDVNKFVTGGKKRISALFDNGTLQVTVAFAAGESNVTLMGYAPSYAPQLAISNGSAGIVGYNTNRQFMVNVSPDNSETATILLTVVSNNLPQVTTPVISPQGSIPAGTVVTLSETLLPPFFAPFTYQWQSNNINIGSAFTSNANTNALQINTAGFAAGSFNYSVIVFNANGSVTSAPVVLTLYIPGQPTNFTLNYGGAPISQSGSADWTATNIWNPGGQPASLSAYLNPGSSYEVVAGAVLRSPAGLNYNSFPGDVLAVDGIGVLNNSAGELRFKNNNDPSTNYFNNLVLKGGQLDQGGNYSTVVIQGMVSVLSNSIIYVDSNATQDRSFQLDCWLTGSKSLRWHQYSGALGGANLRITGTSNTFNGQWIIDQGALIGVSSGSLGTNNITLGTNGVAAALETLYDLNNPNGSLVLGATGKMFLHQNDHFANVVVNGSPLANGTYSFATLNSLYPANFPTTWSLQTGSTVTTGSGQITISAPGPAGPVISVEPQSASVNTNVPSSVTFSVKAQGALPLAYQWFTNTVAPAFALRDNANCVGSASNLLTIPYAASGNLGNYYVVVTNSYGSVTSSVVTLSATASAVVQTAPASAIASQSAVLNGQVVSTGGDAPAVTFFYGPTDGGTAPNAWAQSVSVGVQNGSFSAGITGLTTNTTYYFTVMATNGTGVSWAAASSSFTTPAVSPPLTSYVNPFIGTDPSPLANYGFSFNTGDVFPGADYPLGMFQFSPDTPSKQAGGYWYPDTSIIGFSLRHFSGRGITCYQDFSFQPFLGPVTVSPATSNATYTVGFSHSNESASPGYYSVLLNNGVRVELTTTLRTGTGRFTFPVTNAATLVINAGSSINGTSTNTSIVILGTNQVQGHATSTIGGGSQTYTIYFAAQFDRGFNSSGTWNGSAVNPGTLSATGAQTGAFVSFDATSNQVVYAKIGISFVSVSNAVANLNAEDTNWDFAAIQSAADQAWNNMLSKIVVNGGTTSQMQVFYTALYHCFFHPNVFNDVNGQYLGMDGAVHTVAPGHSQYENIPGWDNYRSAFPLRAFLSASVASDIAQSLVNYAQQGGGGLPRWEQVNRNSGGMIGDGPVIILAAAYALGATNFNTTAALSAMKLNAGTIGTTSDGNTVRSGLNNYISLGYVPNDVSSTLEYCAADFALYQFSQALGDGDPTDLNYLNRSGNWLNLFNPTNNLMQSRNSDGSWVANIAPNSTTGYTEGSAIQYTWLVPFNVKGLFDALGGTSNVVPMLDNYFLQLNAGPSSQYEYIGNEPDECGPWEYDYSGQPWKTQNTARQLQTQCFTNLPSGFPGNDDAGSISSWYVFSALGFFPEIPSAGGFVIGSPMFPSATINLENGRQINIQANNESAQNCYVQSLTINGTNSTSLWLPFRTLRNGANLVFTLGGSPSSWGTGTNNAPPSFPNTVSAPLITTQPAAVSVYPGQTATFSVSVSGLAPFAYQWFTNGTIALSDNVNRMGSTSNTLTILAATTNDAGSYTVVVTNLYGSATSHVAALTLLTPGLTNFTLNFGGSPISQGVGSDWNTINNWNPNGQAASVSANPGNTYEVVVGSRLRSPAGTNNDSFPSDQLTIDGSGNFENGTLNAVGELRFKNNNSTSTNYFKKLILNGGQLDNGANTGIDVPVVLQGQLNIAANSTIYVDSSATLDRDYRIDSWLTGSGNLLWHEFSGELAGPDLLVTGTSNTFSGQWILDQGTLVGTGTNSLGTNNIIVGANGLTAAVETLYNVNNPQGSLILGANGMMFLHQSDTFKSVNVNGAMLSNGTYPFTTLNSLYPANFPATWSLQNGSTITNGSGQIIVGNVTPSSPRFTRISLTGTSLMISATNGSPGGSWTMLQSTNLTIPLSQWQTNLSGNFDSNGSVSTNLVNVITNQQEFYILMTP